MPVESPAPAEPSPHTNEVHGFLKNISRLTRIPEAPKEHQEKILHIIDRNNYIAKLIESDGVNGYKEIVKEEIAMRGESKLGFVYCIDGRIPTIFLAGRFANAWEEPAGLIGLDQTFSDKSIPKSTVLNQAIEEVVREDRDILEIFFAHTGSIDKENTCGYMNELQRIGDVEVGVDLTLENLLRFEEQHIPALKEFYNRQRFINNKLPLSRVGIGAVYETDTMGIVLNYGKETQLSTTDMTNNFREEIEYFIGEHMSHFGSMREKFTDPDNFITFSRRLLDVTKFITDYIEFSSIVDPYLKSNFGDLTESQTQALRFLLARTVAMQYVTGLSENAGDHPFTHHNEDYLSVSLAGKPVGRFDPKEQVFASMPSDTPTALKEIRLKLSLMDKHSSNKPDILFVSNPVKKADWIKYQSSESEAINRNVALNASLFKKIVTDDEIKKRMIDGNLIIIPVLVEQNTGEILTVVDHSAYI